MTSRDLASDLPAALRAIAQAKTCAKESWVFRKGDTAQAVYMVVDGEIRLSRFASDGSEIVLHRAGRGDFFAEAALNAPRYHCNAIASGPTSLLAFPKERMRALLARDAVFAGEWIALLARHLHRARARVERVALRSAAERVLHYLNTEGRGPRCEVVIAGSIKDLARELGLTHESLYRTLARLEQQGVIVREEGRLRLK